MTPSASLLADVAQRALTEESRVNELRVAIVRAAAYTAVIGSSVYLYFAGTRPAVDIAVHAAITLVAYAMLVAIRRWYRPWFRYAIPVIDALVIGFLLGRRTLTSGVTPDTAATAMAACALFATSGGLRFDRSSAVWTTFLAVAALLVVIGPGILAPGLTMAGLPYALFGMAGVGALSVWQTGLVSRIIRGEQGRAMLRRFLPRSVVDGAFTDPSGMSVGPKQVTATVLVTDLRGFTALAESMEPARVVEVLNELHEELAERVNRNGGVVDKFMGDGMLAVFGAPEALDAHPARGLAAALEIREAVEELNGRHPERPPLRIGIGLHTGQLVSGIIGGGRKLEFTVIGDTVNIAARLESLTKEHRADLLLSEDTASLSGAGPFVPLGEAPVRGRAKAVRICTPAPNLKLPRLAPAPTSMSSSPRIQRK